MDTDQDVPTRDQWRVSAVHRAALLLLVALVAAAVGLCAFAALRKKRQLLHKQQAADVEAGTSVSPKVGNLGVVLREAIKKTSMSTCWPSDRGDDSNRLAEETEEEEEEDGLQVGADKGSIAGAATTVSPAVWQRRILMGERCELPHFSGLILYNEQGLPVQHNTCNKVNLPTQQEKPAVILTTLRDLL